MQARDTASECFVAVGAGWVLLLLALSLRGARCWLTVLGAVAECDLVPVFLPLPITSPRLPPLWLWQVFPATSGMPSCTSCIMELLSELVFVIHHSPHLLLGDPL
jgi:hypothetical protein